MDNADLGRIRSSLATSIEDARNQAAEMGIDGEVREIVKHAREMHEVLLEAMEEAPELSTDRLRAYSTATDSEIRAREDQQRTGEMGGALSASQCIQAQISRRTPRSQQQGRPAYESSRRATTDAFACS